MAIAVWINIGTTNTPLSHSFREPDICQTYFTPVQTPPCPFTLIHHIRTLLYLETNHAESGQPWPDKNAIKLPFSGYSNFRRQENNSLFYQPWYKFLHPVSTAYYVFALRKIVI